MGEKIVLICVFLGFAIPHFATAGTYSQCAEYLRSAGLRVRTWNRQPLFTSSTSPIKIGLLISPDFFYEGTPDVKWFGLSDVKNRRVLQIIDANEINDPQKLKTSLEDLAKKNDVVAILAHGNPATVALNEKFSITAENIPLIESAFGKPLLLISCGAGMCSISGEEAVHFSASPQTIDLREQIAVQLAMRSGFNRVIAPNYTIQRGLDWLPTIGMFGFLPTGVRGSKSSRWRIFERISD